MRSALIVAHGQPSAPAGPEARLAEFAARVAALSPGIAVGSATLAAPGALAQAAERLGGDALTVYPLFMSDGWFVSDELPRRLRKVVRQEAAVLAPLGLDPELPALARRAALEGCEAAGFAPLETTLILAAHGSPKDRRPAAAARQIGESLEGFAAIRYGFVDEAPSIADAASVTGRAICLPLFVDANSHVRSDLPEALAEARFTGPVLPPIGLRPECVGLVAAALREAAVAAG